MAALSTKAILSVRYTAYGPGASRSIGRFLRYVQYRDHSQEREREGGIDGFLRYAAYRDRTSPRGRLFDADGDGNERARRQLNAYIKRSGQGLPEPAPGRRPHRAAYRFVISPEDGRGLDLRQLTRATMAQLERDAGRGGLGPWIAAEHRNTDHAHVHVVLAARRAVAPGRYRTLVITKPRLQRMKEAMTRELERQRGRDRTNPLERLLEHHRPRRREWSLSLAFDRALSRMVAANLREAHRLALEQQRENEWER